MARCVRSWTRDSILSEGDDWRHQRRTIAPALAPRVVPMLARHIAQATDEAIARIVPEPIMRDAAPVNRASGLPRGAPCCQSGLASAARACQIGEDAAFRPARVQMRRSQRTSSRDGNIAASGATSSNFNSTPTPTVTGATAIDPYQGSPQPPIAAASSGSSPIPACGYNAGNIPNTSSHFGPMQYYSYTPKVIGGVTVNIPDGQTINLPNSAVFDASATGAAGCPR